MRRIILRNGLFAGIFLGGSIFAWWPFVSEGFDMDLGQVIGYSTMTIAFGLAIMLGTRSYQQQRGKLGLSFGKAFVMGLAITGLASAIYALGWMLYLEVSGYDFMADYANAMLAQAEAAGQSAAEISAMQADMAQWVELYKNPLVRFGMTFMEPLPVGIVVSLIASFVFKKKGLAESV